MNVQEALTNKQETLYKLLTIKTGYYTYSATWYIDIYSYLYNNCFIWYFNKKKKYNAVGTIPKSNIKLVERYKIDTNSIPIHDRSLSWIDTSTSITRGGGKRVVKCPNLPSL